MRVDIVRPGRLNAAVRRTLAMAVPAFLSFSAFAVSPERVIPSQIPVQLEQQGWQHSSGADGAAYYRAPQPPAATVASQDRSAADLDQAELRRMLRERGWRLETDAQGNLLLIPVRPPTPPDIHQMLRARGWRVLTDMDGNTLLMPLAAPAPEQIGRAHV